MQLVRVAHSPDADDYFMFDGLKRSAGELQFNFSFDAFDTQTLNELALEGKADVIAVSAAVLPQIVDSYMVLPHGASVGRNYGPVIVSKKPFRIEELQQAVIGSPGELTTAQFVAKELLPDATFVQVPITPFEEIFKQLEKGRIDAAILIHEGQLSFEKRKLHKLIDLGEWWFKQTKLPLPLGVNVIKRSLGEESIQKISALISESIRSAVENPEALIDSLSRLNKERAVDWTTPAEIKRYLGMYANEDTLELKADVRQALRELVSRAAPKASAALQFAP